MSTPETEQARRRLTREEIKALSSEAKKAYAQQAWRDVLPWEGTPSTGDKVLLGSMFAISAFFLALTPLKPFLIAHHPLLLALVTGNTSAVGAAAAFARVSHAWLWPVIVLGTLGSMKFDWLFWFMGRRWGARVLRMFASTPKMRERVDRSAHLPRWVAYVAVFAGILPGAPTALVYAFAGWQKMRLWVFLLVNGLSSLLWVALVAWLGYSAGQSAVDVIVKIDRYALWVSLAIIFAMVFWGARKQQGLGPNSR